MFSLIISIIAIALVAALALASIYYGGTAFQEGSTDAEASTVVNQGQQVQAAVEMAKVAEKWTNTSDQDDLLTEYLKEIPSVRGEKWTIAAAATVANVDIKNDTICIAINERASHSDGDGDKAGSTDYTLPTASFHTTSQFGCYKDSTQAVAFFKL